MLTWDEFVETLPKPRDVPKVSQKAVRRLYKGFVSGEQDEAALWDVESGLIDRGRLWIDLVDLGALLRWTDDLDVASEDLIQVVGDKIVHTLPVSGAKIVVGSVVDSGDNSYLDFELDRTKVVETLHDYGMLESDSFTDLELPLIQLEDARKTRDFKKRMIAVDGFINTTHTSYVLAENFVESSPLETGEFLGRLSDPTKVYPSISRKMKPVRVKRHERRSL